MAEERPGSSGDSGRWIKNDPGLVGSRVPVFKKPVLSTEDQETLDSLSSAYDFYKLFQPDSYVNEVLYQSKLYAVQKNYPKKQLENLSMDAYRLALDNFCLFFGKV